MSSITLKSAKPDANAALVVRFLNTLPVLAPDLASAQLFGFLGGTLDEGKMRDVVDAELYRNRKG